MKGDRERLLAEGFDGYLEKPISVREFPDQVRSYCRRERRGVTATHRPKILVVDDAPQNARLLEAILLRTATT